MCVIERCTSSMSIQQTVGPTDDDQASFYLLDLLAADTCSWLADLQAFAI